MKSKMPKRAIGFTAWRPFQHKPKVRRTRTETTDAQELKISAWDHVMATSHKVDKDRVNWPGIVYMQQECGLFDPTPRLVRRR